MAYPLTRAKCGQSFIVARVLTGHGAAARKLAAFGIEEGVCIRLLQNRLAYVIAAGYTEIALDRQTAAAILVVGENE